jgi:pyruvate formate lyase activating enzyme
VDYKAPFSMYDEVCGSGAKGGEGVRESLRLLEESDVDYEVRVTMIPQITEKKLAGMAESLPRLGRFVLQLYRPVNDEGELKLVEADDAAAGGPYTPAELRRLALAVRYAQPNVSVRA